MKRSETETKRGREEVTNLSGSGDGSVVAREGDHSEVVRGGEVGDCRKKARKEPASERARRGVSMYFARERKRNPHATPPDHESETGDE